MSLFTIYITSKCAEREKERKKERERMREKRGRKEGEKRIFFISFELW